jgi:hypothetical protein
MCFKVDESQNALIHMKDLQVEGDANYTIPIPKSNTQEYQYPAKLSFMLNFLGHEHPTPQQHDVT